jgi:hypothetical protein
MRSSVPCRTSERVGVNVDISYAQAKEQHSTIPVVHAYEMGRRPWTRIGRAQTSDAVEKLPSRARLEAQDRNSPSTVIWKRVRLKSPKQAAFSPGVGA